MNRSFSRRSARARSASSPALSRPSLTDTDWSDQISAADLKELSDPTVLTRRVWLETEWNKFTDGTSIVEETLGALWAWRLTDSMDWALRLKLPAKFSRRE